MRAERALLADQALHDRGDRDHRGVAGENGVAARPQLDLGKQLLLEIELLSDRFDDKVGVPHRFGQIDARLHASGGIFIVTEIAQIRGDPRLHRVEILNHRVGDFHVVAGKRKDLRNAMAHQAGANNGNTRFPHVLGHSQPAV